MICFPATHLPVVGVVLVDGGSGPLLDLEQLDPFLSPFLVRSLELQLLRVSVQSVVHVLQFLLLRGVGVVQGHRFGVLVLGQTTRSVRSEPKLHCAWVLRKTWKGRRLVVQRRGNLAQGF